MSDILSYWLLEQHNSVDFKKTFYLLDNGRIRNKCQNLLIDDEDYQIVVLSYIYSHPHSFIHAATKEISTVKAA